MIATRTPSVEEFIRAGGERSEFVGGERIEKPLAGFQHGQLQLDLGAALLTYGRESGVGRPFSEVHFQFGPDDDKRIYLPDLAFVFESRVEALPKYGTSAPGIAVEIISPSQSASGLLNKVEFYLKNGVQSVWIVDPEKRQVDLYKPDRRMQTFRVGNVLTDDLLPGFAIALSDLFQFPT